MISANQIVAHLVGDYILQSDWMATEKVSSSFAAAVHATTYALPFLLFRPSLAAFAFIVVTHFAIDRWRLARYVVWAKNALAPWRRHLALGWGAIPVNERPSSAYVWCAPGFTAWAKCRQTGYDESRPVWLTTWLLIIADNTLHLICNGIALKYL